MANNDRPQPSIGQIARARQRGYYWSHHHGAFIRMIDLFNGHAQVDLAPFDLIPDEPAAGPSYIIWWRDHPELIDFFRGFTWLRHIIRIKKPCSVIVDNVGNIVRSVS